MQNKTKFTKNIQLMTNLFIIYSGLYLFYLSFVGIGLERIQEWIWWGIQTSEIRLPVRLVLLVTNIIVGSVFLFKINYLKFDLLKWTNISFAYLASKVVLITIVDLVSFFIEPGGDPWGLGRIMMLAGIIRTVIYITIIIVIWKKFYKHIENARENKLMIFN
jgi:hypothetical protein